MTIVIKNGKSDFSSCCRLVDEIYDFAEDAEHVSDQAVQITYNIYFPCQGRLLDSQKKEITFD